MENQTVDSFQKSKWPMFDRKFAQRIKEQYPDIWAKGGNIKGNAQYEILTKIADQGGVAKTDAQVEALKLREAWIARHRQDFLLAGTIAQIKWLAIGEKGEDYMKNLVNDSIDNLEHSDDDFISFEGIGEYLEHKGLSDSEIDDFLEHFGVKGMRWGQRKVRNTNSTSTNKTHKKRLSDKQKAYIKFYGLRLGAAVAGVAVAEASFRMNNDPVFSQKAVNFAAKAGRTTAKVVYLPKNTIASGKSYLKKDIKVYKPGKGPKIGTYQNAQRFQKTLTTGRKALTIGG